MLAFAEDREVSEGIASAESAVSVLCDLDASERPFSSDSDDMFSIVSLFCCCLLAPAVTTYYYYYLLLPLIICYTFSPGTSRCIWWFRYVLCKEQ